MLYESRTSELALSSRGMHVGPDEQAWWRFYLGYQLQCGDRLAEAEFKKILELQPKHHRARMRLAFIALRKSGQVNWPAIDDPLRLEARIEVLYFAAAGALSAQAFRSAESPEAVAMRAQALDWLRDCCAEV